jgi:redox-sensitive bicupin YhaK (pirin superfamily)
MKYKRKDDFMLNIQRYADLGAMDISWLAARYHFSFSNYYNPKRMGFGSLRVINDDIVKVGGGFDMHSHKDMEIITYVRKGAITHRDNLGNEGKTGAGDVQVMSAGTGITHAEHNEEQEDTNLYQIWIEPHTKGVAPRWEARAFDKTPVKDKLNLLVSGLPEHKDSEVLFIHANAAIYGGVVKQGVRLEQPLSGNAYVLVSAGEVRVDGEVLTRGDGAEITESKSLSLEALSDAEILVIVLPV